MANHQTPQLHPPFLPTRLTSQPNAPALLHLRRDNLIPVCLQNSSPDDEKSTGYVEGHVTNTRFGSYPHSTLLDVQWGSQVRASLVDTGSRGQKKRQQQQDPQPSVEDTRSATPPVDVPQPADSHPTSPRKRTAQEPAPLQPPSKKQQTSSRPPKQAATGFAHLLPLTPEGWTISLPHRTQVVYTPDYSYIIQRLRIRPGSRAIEAGAGSGSFTHAAARVVYNGKSGAHAGRVYSFEYHQPRAEHLETEVKEHGIGSLVTVSHRDVYKDGFMLSAESSTHSGRDYAETEANAARQQDFRQADFEPSSPPTQLQTSEEVLSPKANHVFLDLPSPSFALPHLTRTTPSALDPKCPIHLCAFLPCIEQVTSFITNLRAHSWVEISMCELLHKRLEVRRERVGLDLEGLRGVNASAATVEESLARLREVQRRDRDFREVSTAKERIGLERAQLRLEKYLERSDEEDLSDHEFLVPDKEEILQREPAETRAARLERIKVQQKNRKSWREGRLVCRSEPEVKNHTSYLVFAILPREWTEEDEIAAKEKWKGGGEKLEGKKMSKKEKKKERKRREREAEQSKNKEGAVEQAERQTREGVEDASDGVDDGGVQLP